MPFKISAVASLKAGRGKKNLTPLKIFLPAVPNLIIITLVQHISDNTVTMIILTSGLSASIQAYPIIHYYNGGH